jgi:hypothetical protein
MSIATWCLIATIIFFAMIGVDIYFFIVMGLNIIVTLFSIGIICYYVIVQTLVNEVLK